MRSAPFGTLAAVGATCVSPFRAPTKWDRWLDRPTNGRCRIHGGPSAGPKFGNVLGRLAESDRRRSERPEDSERKRGKREEVTQQVDTL